MQPVEVRVAAVEQRERARLGREQVLIAIVKKRALLPHSL